MHTDFIKDEPGLQGLRQGCVAQVLHKLPSYDKVADGVTSKSGLALAP